MDIDAQEKHIRRLMEFEAYARPILARVEEAFAQYDAMKSASVAIEREPATPEPQSPTHDTPAAGAEVIEPAAVPVVVLTEDNAAVEEPISLEPAAEQVDAPAEEPASESGETTEAPVETATPEQPAVEPEPEPEVVETQGDVAPEVAPASEPVAIIPEPDPVAADPAPSAVEQPDNETPPPAAA